MMLGKRLKKGLHPAARREYLGDYVHTVYEPAGETVFPLSDRFGVSGKALVAPGDAVLAGQRLSEGGAYPGDGAFSSCSGTVKAIERRPTADGEAVCVVVDNDRRFRPAEGLGAAAEWQDMSRPEILRRIREAGVSGLNGKRVPTADDLEALPVDKVSRIAADASEWEPLVSSDNDLLQTRGYGVAIGMRILQRLFPGADCVILLGDGMKSAAEAMEYFLRNSAGIHLLTLPQGASPGNEEMIGALISGGKAEKGICLTESAAAVF